MTGPLHTTCPLCGLPTVKDAPGDRWLCDYGHVFETDEKLDSERTAAQDMEAAREQGETERLL
jgi:hypothetical protein